MSKMYSASAVINKNNLAAAALRQGHYRDALVVMREATVTLNSIHRRSDIRTRYPVRPMDSFPPIQSSPVGPMHGHPAIESGSSAMFRRAIILSQQEESVQVISAVVLFNLALCHHLIGTSLNSSGRICSALQFYKMSYQIMEENRHLCIFGDLLVLALINNIAEAWAQVCEVRKAREWFDFLSKILGVESDDQRSLPALDEEDYVFFYMNAMLHHGETMDIAPAA